MALSKGDVTGEKVATLALLIPVYNRQALLERTLLSIVDPTDMDIIVVDDGSEPPITISEGITTKKCTIIRLAENSGITKALNAGLDYILSRGYKYVARIDAGDIAVPGRFAKQMQFLATNPNYGLVGSKVREIKSREVLADDLPSPVLQRKLHIYNPIAHPAVMLTSAAMRKTGFYDPRFKGCEDWDYWIRLSKKFNIKNLNETLTLLDDSMGSICRDTDSKFRLRRRWTQLRMLLEHFEPLMWASYAGIAKLCLVLFVNIVIPSKLIVRRKDIILNIKTLFGRIE